LDLSFPRFDRTTELVAWPGDLAVLMIGVAARQGASRTALAQAGLPTPDIGAADGTARMFAPLDGAFNGAVAASMVRWIDEVTSRKDE
jgi:hypothetical protein